METHRYEEQRDVTYENKELEETKWKYLGAVIESQGDFKGKINYGIAITDITNCIEFS